MNDFNGLAVHKRSSPGVNIERGTLTRGEMNAAVPAIIRSTGQCYTARQEDIDNRSVSRRHDDMRRRGLASPDDGGGAHLRPLGRQARLGRVAPLEALQKLKRWVV